MESGRSSRQTALDVAPLPESARQRPVMLVQREQTAAKEAVLASLPDREWIERRLQHFDLRVFWYEPVELVRKALLVGLSVLVPQGTFWQLIVGAAIATFLLTILTSLKPYRQRTDNVLTIMCQLVVLLNLLLALLLKGVTMTEEMDIMSASDSDDVVDAI